MTYGSLRVINEDHVTPGDGFPTHPHSNFEIFSYVIGGAIKHTDSMGNIEVCKPGDIQFTSAGTGIAHSEFSKKEFGPLHFLQIWVLPNAKNLKPSYQTQHFSDEEKRGKLCLCLSGTGENKSIKINQDIKVFASKLEQGESVDYILNLGRKGYIHLIESTGSVEVSLSRKNTIELQGGDGAFLSNGRLKITATSVQQSHFILFDLEE